MLKIMASLICLSGSIAIAQGTVRTSVQTGSFSMLKEPKGKLNEGCSIGLKLVLDKAEVSGSIALFYSFVNGFCEIYVAPDPRYLLITDIKLDNCGTKTYSGKIKQLDFISDITIADNRARVCEDATPGLIVFKETLTSQETRAQTQRVFYSIVR